MIVIDDDNDEKKNVLFWESVERYRSIRDLKQRQEMARHLFHRFIPVSSPLSLNMPNDIISAVEKAYGNGDIDVFDAAQLCTEIAMTDTFARYRETAEYQQLTAGLQSFK